MPKIHVNAARVNAGLSQEDLADKMGVTRQTLLLGSRISARCLHRRYLCSAILQGFLWTILFCLRSLLKVDSVIDIYHREGRP